MASRSVTVVGRGSAFIGAQFRQLSVPEVPVGELGMRNDKVTLPHLPVAESNDVQIQGAGSPALGALAAFSALDLLACLEQAPGCKGGLEQHHLIEVGGLDHAAKRRSLFHGGSRQQSGAGERVQRFTGGPEMRGAIAEIAAERDEDTLKPRRQSDSRSAGDPLLDRPAAGWRAPARPVRPTPLRPAGPECRYPPGSWPSWPRPARSGW